MPPERRCLPFAEWPEKDRDLWWRGTAPVGLFEPQQAGSNWAVRSRLKTEHGYGRFLQFLRGAKLFDPATEPTERVTRENVEAYVAELSSCCAPYTVATRMQELCDAMRVLAPGQDWSWMRQLSERLYARAQPSVDKRPRLRPSGELQAFGRKLMTTAEHNQGAGDKKWAVMYRDGLIISLLAYRPLRVRNFSTIRIGINLLQDGTGYLIRFNGNETKQGQSVESVFPKSLAANLRRYLDHYRTILLTVGAAQPIDTDALWISLRGTPLSPRSLANPINKRTRVAFGKSLPPHWFRHCAGTTIAVEDSRHVADTQHVLGHSNPRTAEEHYNRARGIEASRRHQRVMAALHEPLRVKGLSGGI